MCANPTVSTFSYDHYWTHGNKNVCSFRPGRRYLITEFRSPDWVRKEPCVLGKSDSPALLHSHHYRWVSSLMKTPRDQSLTTIFKVHRIHGRDYGLYSGDAVLTRPDHNRTCVLLSRFCGLYPLGLSILTSQSFEREREIRVRQVLKRLRDPLPPSCYLVTKLDRF